MLDIGKNMDQVSKSQKSQKDRGSKRECWLSKEIDEEFEEEKHQLPEKKRKARAPFSGNFVHNGGWCRKWSFRWFNEQCYFKLKFKPLKTLL